MSTQKIKSKTQNQRKTGFYIAPSPSHGTASLTALMRPSYHPSQNKELAKKLAEKERDLEQRTEYNSIINKLMEDEDYIGIVKTWKNTEGDNKPQNRGSPGTPNISSQTKTLKRSLPIAINKSNGGRKRNSTKKKRHSKTKKRGNKKNQRK